MINWNYIHQEWDWAGHILEGAVLSLVVSLLFRLTIPKKFAVVAGLAFAIGHFHGREKRDHEIAEKIVPPHLEGYYFWNWSLDGLTDFWPSTIILSAVIIWITRKQY